MTVQKPSSTDSRPRLAAVMAKPYVAGARVQLERYLEAQRLVTTYHTGITGYDRCLYELSALLEHLDTVAVCLDTCGIRLPIIATINDVRNHVRHDARGDADWSGGKRAKNIGLHPNAQAHIVFSDGGVTVGKTELKAEQISGFLDAAEMAINALLLGGHVSVSDGVVTVGRQPAED